MEPSSALGNDLDPNILADVQIQAVHPEVLSLDLKGLMQIVQNEPRRFYQKVSSGYRQSVQLHELDLRILSMESY
ncbi:hypothetical protein EAE99_008504 [Botrytis elliptica]|nr:hypothetical protein EAE99_008504 [Botrytis elliptica]